MLRPRAGNGCGGGVYYGRFGVGEVAELAEGSRLLSGYRVKSSVPGSNPGLSAKYLRGPETARAPSHLGARVRVRAACGGYCCFFWSVIPAAFAASSYLASDSACLPASCRELAWDASDRALAEPASKRFPIARSM